MPVLRSSTEPAAPDSAISAAPSSRRARLPPSPTRPAAVDVGDRRVVTALFADLVDYVRMLAEHDPEEVRARVGRALVRMGDAIERLGGTREKFIGDAVFAVFGWPQAHDDDPVRAALAALEIRATLLEPEDGGEPLEVRIGLATGEVVAAARGDGTGDQAVTGEAITTAARIQGLARPGEILLDEATVRGARDRLSVEDRGSVVLRGQSLVVRLFSLSGQSGLTDPGSRRPTRDTPLVGRTTELAHVRRALKRARRSGRGAVVLVTGEAGMGKSRLVADVESEARALGLRLDLDGERLVRTRRAIPIRPAVRPADRRRARHRFGQLCAQAAVHAGHRRGRAASVRRRDRRCRPGCGVLGLGGGGRQRPR